jgi:hypothetical protein
VMIVLLLFLQKQNLKGVVVNREGP